VSPIDSLIVEIKLTHKGRLPNRLYFWIAVVGLHQLVYNTEGMQTARKSAVEGFFTEQAQRYRTVVAGYEQLDLEEAKAPA